MMKPIVRLRTVGAPLLLIVVLLTFVGAGTVQAASTLPSASTAKSWKIVSSPNTSATVNLLGSVAAFSASDVWAVGYDRILIRGVPTQRTLTEQWNGTAWSVITSPNTTQGDNVLGGTVAFSPTSAWATGNAYDPTTNHVLTLVEQWNGTAWSVVPSPNPSTTDNNLGGIASVSAHNIWAVGGYFPSTTGQTLTEHWNGTAWSVVPSPNPGGSIGSSLGGVAHVKGTSQLWSVGNFVNSSGNNQTLTELHC